MKKTISIILSVLFVLSFAASAFAVHAEIPAETQAVVGKGDTQITLGGDIRVRGWLRDNFATLTIGDINEDDIAKTKFYSFVMPWNIGYVEALNADKDDITAKAAKAKSHGFYDQRVRLSVNAQVSPNVQGYIALESNSKDADTWKFGLTEDSAKNTAGRKPSSMNILESWILYKGSGLFGFPAGVKIGHMPLSLGEKQFMDHTKFGDDALVFFMDPTKELHIGLLTVKASENGAGGSSSYSNNNDDIDAYVALATYKVANYGTVGMNYAYANWSEMDLSFQNLGLHTNGKIGNIGLKAEVDFQFGHVGEGEGRAKFGGYALMAGLNYDMKPINLRAQFAMGSGDSNSDDNKIKEFQTMLGNDIHSTFIHEFMISSAASHQLLTAAAVPGGNASGTNSGLANVTQYNLGFDYQASKEMKLAFDGYILRATKVENGSGMSKNLGWEIDFNGSYAIAKNLNYFLRAGYFKPGAFYNPANFIGAEAAEENCIAKKGVTMVMHGIQLSF